MKTCKRVSENRCSPHTGKMDKGCQLSKKNRCILIKNLKTQKIQQKSHQKIQTPQGFKKEIINAYNKSGIGIQDLQIQINIKTQNIKKYMGFGKEVAQFISSVATNRIQHPSFEILRKASSNLCIPNLVLDYNTQKNISQNLLTKLKKNQKFDIMEKINSPIEISIAYTLIRCYQDYKIAAIPIGVSTNKKDINHANILIFDFRNKKNTSQKSNIIDSYLFEPNGEQFSKSKGIYQTISNYIENTNIILNQINSKYQIDKLKLIGGDGLQTELGEKKMYKQQTVQKKGYPICGAIGYWLIFSWLSSKKEYSLDEYIKYLFQYIKTDKKHRYIMKEEILNLINKIAVYNENNYKKFMKNKIYQNVKDYLKINNQYRNFEDNFILEISYQATSRTNNKFNFKDKIVINNKGLINKDK